MKKVENVAPTAIDAHIGQRILLRRNMLGLTQKALAERCGVTFQQMQKYEKACNRISASRLYQIGMILDTPVSFFFSGLPRQTIDNSMFMARNNFDARNDVKSVSEPTSTDPLARNESLQLINLYWKLPTDDARKTIMALLKTMNGTGN